MGCSTSSAGDFESPRNRGWQDAGSTVYVDQPVEGVILERPQGFDAPFLQRHAPNGEVWADYVAATPPSVEKGRLLGVWADCVYAAVVFEITKPGWDKLPEYRKNSPVGVVVEYASACGYGRKHEKAFISHEEICRRQLERVPTGSRAFLHQIARNGRPWEVYLKYARPVFDSSGTYISGAWGECITAAVIFEQENPKWDELGPYSADGPAGQVIAYLEGMKLDGGGVKEALLETETATHNTVESGGHLPIFDETYYQPSVHILQAPQVNEPPPQPSGRKKAVLVGCNYPGQRAQLAGSVNDVHRWSDLLVKLYGFQPTDIVQLTDEGHSDLMLYPTRQNMLRATRWLTEGSQPGDVLFFHFSGHGGQREPKNGTEADGLHEILVPTDHSQNGVIIDHELFDLLAVPLPPGCKLTVVLDCCHAGIVLDLPFTWNEMTMKWDCVRYPWHTAGDVQLFTVCEDSQSSADSADRYSQTAGPISASLCDVLEAGAHEPPGKYAALLSSLRRVLGERGYRQTPRLTSSQAFDMTRVPFHLTNQIVPNLNSQLGQAVMPRTRPPRLDLGGFRY